MQALDEQGIPYETMELDYRGDGADIQVKACVCCVCLCGVDTVALAASGELKRLFESAQGGQQSETLRVCMTRAERTKRAGEGEKRH
jgi:hypothetical protein